MYLKIGSFQTWSFWTQRLTSFNESDVYFRFLCVLYSHIEVQFVSQKTDKNKFHFATYINSHERRRKRTLYFGNYSNDWWDITL